MAEPLVSIIIRTCGRPQVLETALKSIRTQEYSNIETIIIEDGPNVSEQYIKENFSDLNITYYATESRQGRCRAGNLGMEKASGKYLNFLDDDDYLLPEHVSVLAEQLETGEYPAAYAIAEEHQIRGSQIKRKLIRYKQPYNKLLLCYMNYIPIQSIMFCKSLFEQYGGLDEQLDVLEDWNLWVRYSVHCDFQFIPMVTSVYHTPYKGKNKRKRETVMHQANEKLMLKHQRCHMTLDVQRINDDMDYILNVFNKKGFLFYMQKIRNFLLYRDI